MDKLRKKRLKKTAKKKKKKKRKIGELEEEEEVEAEEGGVEESDRLVRLKAVKPNKAAGGGKRAKIKGDLRLRRRGRRDEREKLLNGVL